MSAALKQEEEVPISIRPGGAQDEAFMFSSWLQSYRGSAFARPIVTKTYYQRHHAVIEAILARPTARLLVATPEDSPDVILGWAVVEPGVLHYAYVKESFRRLGVARRQCVAAGLGATFKHTHKTPAVERIIREHVGLEYDPYLL